MIDRAFTKAEARDIPTVPHARLTWLIRRARATSSCSLPAVPVRRGDAWHPGRAVDFFGQHSYVPDVQDLAANINMRATFLAVATGSPRARCRRTVDRPRADARVPAPRSPSRSTARGTFLLDVLKGGNFVQPMSIIGLNDFHGQLDPTTLAFDKINQTWAVPRSSPRMFDEDRVACPAQHCSWPPATTSALAAELGAARGHAGDRRRNAWASTRPPTATTSSTPASSGSSRSRRGPTSRSSRRTSSTGDRAAPPWVTPSVVFDGRRRHCRRDRRRAREHARARLAGATAALKFLPEAPRSRPSPSGCAAGVRVQVVVIVEARHAA